MLCFAPQTFIFPEMFRMVMCQVRVAYNHVVVFFVQERKTAFKQTNGATFAIC